MTTCTGPVEFIETESTTEGEKGHGEGLETEPTTVVTQEEIETMLKCTMRAMDSNREVMNILLQLNRMCGVVMKDLDED